VIRAWEHEGPDEVVRAVESVLRTESAGPPDQSFS
jgi:hypothetical protein